MSGGALDYCYTHLTVAIDELKDRIRSLEESLKGDGGDLDGYEPNGYYAERHPGRPEFKSARALAEATFKRYRAALKSITEASAHLHNVEWLWSGDYGYEDYVLRTDADLGETGIA